MSNLPRHIRMLKAVRETCEMYDQMSISAEMDAGFDGGEWSRPANAREERRLEFKIAARNSVLQEEVYGELQLQSFQV